MIDYDSLIKRYGPLIKKYSWQYSRGIMPMEDFEQELKIRLWIKVDDHYCSAIGPLENYAYGVINLEARKIRFDMSRQEQFESSLVYCSSVNFTYDSDKSVLLWGKLWNILTDKEREYLNIINNIDDLYFESSENKINKSEVASSLGFSIYETNQILEKVRRKINIVINNQNFF